MLHLLFRFGANTNVLESCAMELDNAINQHRSLARGAQRSPDVRMWQCNLRSSSGRLTSCQWCQCPCPRKGSVLFWRNLEVSTRSWKLWQWMKRISSTVMVTEFSVASQVKSTGTCLRRDFYKPQHVPIGHTCAWRRLAFTSLTRTLYHPTPESG